MKRSAWIGIGLLVLAALTVGWLAGGGAWLEGLLGSDTSREESAGSGDLLGGTAASAGPALKGHEGKRPGEGERNEIDLAALKRSAKAPGVVSGTVRDHTGAPVEGASVRIIDVPPPAEGEIDDWASGYELLLRLLHSRALAELETDAGGRFRHEGAAAGKYLVVVSARGAVTWFHDVIVIGGALSGGPLDVVLERGQLIRRRLVWTDGSPVSDARVIAYTWALMNGEDVRVGTATAGADGWFEMRAPPANDGVSLSIEPGRGSGTVHVQLEEEQDAPIILEAPATVRLRVIADGPPGTLEGREVRVNVNDASERIYAGLGRLDGYGAAELEVSAGVLRDAWIRHPEHGFVELGNPSFSTLVSGRADGKILAGEENARVYRFLTVSRRRITGTITDEAGAPVAGARVTCATVEDGNWSWAYGVSDRQGAYQLRIPEHDVGRFRVTAPGYITHDADNKQSQALGVKGPQQLDVRLTRGLDVVGRVVDERGAGVAGAEVWLKGQTIFDLLPFNVGVGSGIANVAYQRLEFTDATGRPVATTDASGRFLLTGVKPTKKLFVLGRHSGYVTSASSEFRAEGNGMIRAPLLRLHRGRTVKVTVREPSGRPAAGAKVYWSYSRAPGLFSSSPPGDARAAKYSVGSVYRARVHHSVLFTDSAGRVVIEHLPAARIRIYGARPGTGGVLRIVQVGEDTPQVSELELRLRRGTRLGGRVIDDRGKPVAGAFIQVWMHSDAPGVHEEQTWMPSSRADTDEKGRFDFVDIPPGALTVWVQFTGYKSVEVLRVAGRPQDLELLIEPADAARRDRKEALQAEWVVLMKLPIESRSQGSEAAERLAAIGKELARIQEEESGGTSCGCGGAPVPAEGGVACGGAGAACGDDGKG